MEEELERIHGAWSRRCLCHFCCWRLGGFTDSPWRSAPSWRWPHGRCAGRGACGGWSSCWSSLLGDSTCPRGFLVDLWRGGGFGCCSWSRRARGFRRGHCASSEVKSILTHNSSLCPTTSSSPALATNARFDTLSERCLIHLPCARQQDSSPASRNSAFLLAHVSARRHARRAQRCEFRLHDEVHSQAGDKNPQRFTIRRRRARGTRTRATPCGRPSLERRTMPSESCLVQVHARAQGLPTAAQPRSAGSPASSLRRFHTCSPLLTTSPILLPFPPWPPS